jgi:hypothetical protein
MPFLSVSRCHFLRDHENAYLFLTDDMNKQKFYYVKVYVFNCNNRKCKCGLITNIDAWLATWYTVRPTRMRSSIPLLEPGPPRFFWWYENSE